ncbi:MAG TPA: FHA domain-containing protein [Solirubrobacterales bacterium]|nr:FHA domain-containing protein [Solirubrobacterales bacterium]
MAWTLVGLGVLLAVSGLLAGSIPFVVIGVLLALAIAAMPGARRLEIDLLRGRMVLERETVVEAAHGLAIRSGMNQREADDVDRLIEKRLPLKVSLEKLDSGSFTAAMPDGSTVVVPIPFGETPTAQLLALILAEQEISELLVGARRRRIERQFPPTDETWAGSAKQLDPPTTDFGDQVSEEIASQVSKVLDPTKDLLIHPSSKGRSFRVVEIPRGGSLRIGRSEDCEVVLADPTVSREHAIVEFVDNGRGVQICDLESSNGVRVNGQSVEVQPLRHMDLITISKYNLLYYAPEAAAAQGL